MAYAHMPFTRICTALAIVMLITGCASRYSDEGLKKRFIGKSKAHLLSCAGAPTSHQSVEGQEFLTYSIQAQAGYQGSFHTASCRMNFTLSNGYITNITGSWFGPILDKSQACERMLRSC